MMNLEFGDKIIIHKTKKTLKDYEQYWQKILSLIGDKINLILQK